MVQVVAAVVVGTHVLLIHTDGLSFVESAARWQSDRREAGADESVATCERDGRN